MSHAEIEECENSVVAVCPWHRSVILFPYYGESLTMSDMISICALAKARLAFVHAHILSKWNHMRAMMFAKYGSRCLTIVNGEW